MSQTEKVKAREFQCRVISNRPITSTVFELRFETNEPVEFKAGQFISVIVPGAGPGGRNLRRAYSIASAPHVRPIELCVKLVDGGPGTNYLHGLKEGATFQGVAPYGDFVYQTTPNRHACFISTGTGIAPFRSMMQSKQYEQAPPKHAYSFFGVRDEEEILYADELKALKNVTVVTALSRPAGAWNGFKGRVTHYMEALGADFPWTETDYYLCGNGDMIKEIKALLMEKRGVAKEAIHVEKYY